MSSQGDMSLISSGCQTGHYLVRMLPQSCVTSGEEQFVVSGRHVINFVGVSNLEPADILGVAHAPFMCFALDALQYVVRPFDPSPGPPGGDPDLCRYNFNSCSCDRYGIALACSARPFDPATARFVPTRLGTTAGTSARSFI